MTHSTLDQGVSKLFAEFGWGADLFDETSWPKEIRLAMRELDICLKLRSMDRFNRQPKNIGDWFTWLNNGQLSQLPENLAPLVTLFFSQKPVRRQSFDTLWVWMPRGTTELEVLQNLRLLFALGYVAAVGKHDAQGRFCRQAFSFCAEPTRLPILDLMRLGAWVEANEKLSVFFAKLQQQAVAGVPHTDHAAKLLRLLMWYQAIKDSSAYSMEDSLDRPVRPMLKLADILEGAYSTELVVSTRKHEEATNKRGRGRRATRRCKAGTQDPRWTRSKAKPRFT